jgi:formate hydrogenlyase regulatory protein HycA
VQPFQLVQDGITFGLILDSHPDHGVWADLLPNGLRFHAPWDGEYDT